MLAELDELLVSRLPENKLPSVQTSIETKTWGGGRMGT